MSIMRIIAGLYQEDSVVLKEGQHSWSLHDFQARVLQWRARMALPAGYTVALYGDNSVDWIAIDLACMEAGLVLVPLPGFFSDRQIRHILEQTNPAVILSDDPQRTDPLCRHQSTIIPDSVFAVARHPCPVRAVCPSGTGKITFTSGSTGEPRGVCLSTAHLLLQASRLRDRVGLARPAHLCVLPLSTLLENVAGVYAPLLAGGEICLLPLKTMGFKGSNSLDIPVFLHTLQTIQPQSLILIPQLLQVLTGAIQKGWKAPESLEFVAVGGSRVAPGLLLSAREGGIPAFEGYGLSECGSVVSLNVSGADKSGTTGKALDGISVELRNGEIVVKGSVMLGYLDDTASWYPLEICTGDLGETDEDGFISVTGRCRNLLISSYGRNISPEWVESELLQNPVLAEALVFGDARPYCVALVSTRLPGDTGAAARWIDSLNRSLPDYARIRQWHVLDKPLSEFHGLLTANGRPKRDAIGRYFAAEIDNLYQKKSAGSASCAVN